MLSNSLSVIREEDGTYVVNGVEPALVLEHHNLLLEPGRHSRYTTIFKIHLDGLGTVGERHVEDFAGWCDRVLAREKIREAGVA